VAAPERPAPVTSGPRISANAARWRPDRPPQEIIEEISAERVGLRRRRSQ
jgi:hypothetical protein